MPGSSRRSTQSRCYTRNHCGTERPSGRWFPSVNGTSTVCRGSRSAWMEEQANRSHGSASNRLVERPGGTMFMLPGPLIADSAPKSRPEQRRKRAGACMQHPDSGKGRGDSASEVHQYKRTSASVRAQKYVGSRTRLPHVSGGTASRVPNDCGMTGARVTRTKACRSRRFVRRRLRIPAQFGHPFTSGRAASVGP